MMIGSQMPGLLIIALLARLVGLPSAVAFSAGFITQAIIYMLLLYWLLGFVFRQRDRREFKG